MGKLGRLESVLRAVSGQAPDAKYIRAYHGSPYDFDRFDASKIGTGEGAQAYGHGLYFAGNEAVADSYRRMTSLPAWTPEEFATNWWRTNSGIHANDAAMAKAVTVRDIEEAMKAALSGVPFPKETPPDFMQQGLEFLRRAGDTPPPPVRRGRMYEVAIGHPEDALLDWDAPVLSQPQHIVDAMRAMGAIPDIATPTRWRGGDAYQKSVTRAANDRYAPLSARTAADIATIRMRQEGIPGIRYLDGNSRTAGQGTRNFVMFPGTEDSIRILRKYGLLPPIAAGAASGAMTDSPAEER